VHLGEHFTLWPRVSGGFYHVWGGGQSTTSVSVGAFAPLLWHPFDHFFLGLGPAAYWSFDGPRLGDLQQSQRQLNVRSVFGGYF
jgi:hypothetical protein